MRNWILLVTMIGILGTESSLAQITQSVDQRIQIRRASQIDSLRRVLGISPALRLDWKPTRTGVDIFQASDDFNRTEIGSDWACDERFWAIVDGELSTTAEATSGWRYLAVFRWIHNDANHRIHSVSYRWGRNADAVGIREGAMALMVDSPSPQGSGYWLWHRYRGVWLWIISNGSWEYSPGEGKEVDRQPGISNPGAGDVVTGVVRNEADAVYFDYYINDQFDATVKDYSKEFGQGNTWYVGLFLRGEQLNNQVDDFTVTWLQGDQVAPAEVTDLRVVDVATSTVTLEWTSTGDNGYDGQADHLELRYSTSPINTDNFSSATLAPNLPSPAEPGQTQSFTVTGLQDNTTYYFALKIFDEVNNVSGLSNIVQAMTLRDGTQGDQVAPAEVTDLRVVDVTTSAVTLEWTATGDNGFEGQAEYLELRYSTSPIDDESFPTETLAPNLPFPAEPGQTQRFTVTGLQDNTTYYFALKIFDEVHNASGLSNIVQARTLRDAAATNLTMVSGCNQVGMVGRALPMPLTAKVTDRHGMPVSAYPVQFVVVSGGGNVDGDSSQTLSTDSSGQAAVIWTLGTAAGSSNHVVEIRANGLAGSPLRCAASALPRRPPIVIYLGGNGQMIPVNAISAPLRIRLLDDFANPFVGEAVEFSIHSGGGYFVKDQLPAGRFYRTICDSSGIASAVVTASEAWGDTTKITATVGDTTISFKPAVEFFVVAAPPDSMIVIKGNNQTATVKTTLAESLVVKILDAVGAPAKKYPVTFRILSGAGTLTDTLSQVEITTDSSGFAGTRWTLGPIAGWQKIEAKASFNGRNLRNAPFVFRANAQTGAVSATRSTISVSPSRCIPADSLSAAVVTVTVRDGFDNPVSGKTVRISVSGSSNYITQPAQPTDSTGTATALLRSTSTGWKTVSAMVVDDSLMLAQTVQVLFITIPAVKIEIYSGNHQKAVVNQPLPKPVVVQTLDRLGNPMQHIDVLFHVRSGGGRVIGDSVVVTDSSGLASAIWQMGPVPGINTLEARRAGLIGSPVLFTATAVDSIMKVQDNAGKIPHQFALYQNFPNPLRVSAFKPEMTIQFDLPEAGQTELMVYDLAGRRVRQLLTAPMPAGAHHLRWNGHDDNGHPVNSGVYLFVLRVRTDGLTRELVATRKSVLIK
ncbi:MAG: Ig-like domain-containing protein [candidate division KSB1 bacterium]|nr:Ig-like domain-containing protein [candidate division KSB1 bacterium]MDZ7311177.1 Ig-like domain-containing protein [candidate division KSB1 bacterium]